MAEPENAESTVQFDAEDYEEHQENLNQETPIEFPKSDIKQYFTFDDIPPSKWRERSIEMLTWCTAELQYYTIDVVIKRFLTKLQGRLRDCPWEHTTHAREEFLKMKCCSFQKKDLEKHYDRMSQRLYYLNGVDDVNLKQFFLNSIPESLGNEAYQALEAKNVTIAQTTLGELYQLILNALAKLCNQKKFLVEFERTGKRLGTTCDDKYLQIKCKEKCHFARNCPDKKRSQALIQALNQVEPVDVSDLESHYSLDDEPSDSVLCTIAYSDFSSDDDSDTDSLESDSDFGVHMINPIVKVHLLTDAYANPIPDIAFFDTGSSVSILNLNILPDHHWKPHHQNFMAANREKFVIDKISVPINIRLFPKYTRSLMARANDVDPDKIPYYVMWNISVWSKDHPDAYKWIEANGQWLYGNFDHCEVKTSDDDDDARSLWSSNDDEHFDPFEDNPTHPDARWSQ
ncbi:hypothetical protein Tco_0318042 [Tanacetum coccineum]